jgi:hypothetical protein
MLNMDLKIATFMNVYTFRTVTSYIYDCMYHEVIYIAYSCGYARIHVCTYIHTRQHLRTRVWVDTIFTNVYVPVCIDTYTRMYIHTTYARIHVCTHIHTLTLIRTLPRIRTR